MIFSTWINFIDWDDILCCCPDSSPTYQLVNKGSKNKAKDKDKNFLKEAPLVDPEPTSDISNFNVPNTNNGNISNDATKAAGKALHSALSTHGKIQIEYIELNQ